MFVSVLISPGVGEMYGIHSRRELSERGRAGQAQSRCAWVRREHGVHAGWAPGERGVGARWV